jgi:hypothetical protein
MGRTALAVLLWMCAGLWSVHGAVLVPYDTAPINATSSILPVIVLPRPDDGGSFIVSAAAFLPAQPNGSTLSTASAMALPQATLVATAASSSGYFYRKGNRVIAYEVYITTLQSLTGIPNLVVLDPHQDVYVQAWDITIVGQVKVPGRAITLVAKEIKCDNPSAGCELDSSGATALLLPSNCITLRCCITCILISVLTWNSLTSCVRQRWCELRLCKFGGQWS